MVELSLFLGLDLDLFKQLLFDYESFNKLFLYLAIGF